MNGKKDAHSRFTEEMGFDLIEKGKEMGINVTFWLGTDKYIYSDDHKNICAWLFSRAYITGSMRVVPCCVIADADTKDMGVALPFNNTWNDDEYIKIRRQHLSGQIPYICRNCYEEIEHRK